MSADLGIRNSSRLGVPFDRFRAGFARDGFRSGIRNDIYSYDFVGNRLTDSRRPADQWVYDDNDQLLDDGVNTYQYDANGNLTGIRNKESGILERKFEYDIEGRLIRAEKSDQSVAATYYYDPFGRRLSKKVFVFSSGSWVPSSEFFFHYSNEGLIGEYDASGNETRSYGYEPNSTWGTKPVFLREGNSYYWYQLDQLGTPRILTNSAGTIVWSADYADFGSATVTTGTVTNNLRFPGQYFDEETGLHYNWNRYYDPGTGRYISTDPLLEGENLYSYVGGNPLRWIDPLGEFGVQIGDLNIGVGAPTLAFSSNPYNDIYNDIYHSPLGQDLGVGAVATADGIIPFANPFANAGYYDPCNGAARVSQGFGAIGRDALMFAAGTGTSLRLMEGIAPGSTASLSLLEQTGVGLSLRGAILKTAATEALGPTGGALVGAGITGIGIGTGIDSVSNVIGIGKGLSEL